MKRMLINATQREELRIALIDGKNLYELNMETNKHKQKKSNIYKGKIIRIEPSLEAAFVDYGEEKHGFLPMKEISQEYFFPKCTTNSAKPNIRDVLKEGQEIIVQINKEERGNKGATLTTFISLAGSYLVLMPNSPKSGGISRHIEGEDRAELKETLSALELPDGMSLIVRTAGAGKSIKTLQWDLSFRLKHWKAIRKAAENHSAPYLINQESNLIVRAFRDYLRPDIGEILIDDPEILDVAKKYIEFLGRPDFAKKIKLYDREMPIFSYFKIESQIESVFQRKLRLPSGGSIVIDITEALTAIDINSARSTRYGDIEETAFNTNLEAVEEIAKQLRLRDLGGLIVIDFIDMSSLDHQREIEVYLREAMRYDRARIQIGKISKFGLLELSRQRLYPYLGEYNHRICSRCSGKGIIRGNESLSLSILRIIEEKALKEDTHEVRAIVPVPIASYLLNEKREAINSIEKRQQGVRAIIIPDNHMQTPNFTVLRIRKGDKLTTLSYFLPKIHKSELLQNTKKFFLDKKKDKKIISFQKKSGSFFLKKHLLKKKLSLEKIKKNRHLNFKFIKKFLFFILKKIRHILNLKKEYKNKKNKTDILRSKSFLEKNIKFNQNKIYLHRRIYKNKNKKSKNFHMTSSFNKQTFKKNKYPYKSWKNNFHNVRSSYFINKFLIFKKSKDTLEK